LDSNIKIIGKSLYRSIKNFLDDDPFTYAASLAFYTVISLPAILLIAINILSAAYDRDTITEDLLTQLNKYLGPSTVNQAETIIENASASYSGIIPQLIGWGVLLVSATTVFVSLQNGINKVWGVRPSKDAPWYSVLIDRLLSFAMLVSIGFVLLVSLVIDSMISFFSQWMIDNFGQAESIILWVGNITLSFLVTSAIFTVLYRTLPDVKIEWKYVWIGGMFTSLMFLVGKFLIGYFLTTTDAGSAYGASGSLVVFLSWVYYSSALVLFGSKFTFEYTLLKENTLSTQSHAVFVEEKKVADDKIATESKLR